MKQPELDLAIAREAQRRVGFSGCDALGVEVLRLAREGWAPPDPLMAEAQAIVRSDTWHGIGGADELALRALRRGIEIGKAERA